MHPMAYKGTKLAPTAHSTCSGASDSPLCVQRDNTNGMASLVASAVCRRGLKLNLEAHRQHRAYIGQEQRYVSTERCGSTVGTRRTASGAASHFHLAANIGKCGHRYSSVQCQRQQDTGGIRTAGYYYTLAQCCCSCL